ncbi:MAG: domain S-box protein [Marmoricola sp.]|nr:domain S-box protein [Marmoricola sp.]
MSVTRWAQCALLLVLVGIPLSIPGVESTAYGGWPSIGFAIALFLLAGPERRWIVLAAETLVTMPALAYSYEVAWWQAALGSLAVTLPSLLSAQLRGPGHTGRLRLDEVDTARYHLVTLGSALVCGVLAMAASATLLSLREVLISGLMSGLAALTAQLVVLPLLIRSSVTRAAGKPLELMLQRALLLGIGLAVFYPVTALGTSFLVFPVLGWAALRATLRETHVQLFLICVGAYVMTFTGRGPFTGNLQGIPEDLASSLVYLFVASACYLTVPLTLTVQKLISMTGQATRAATTVERLLDSVSGALIIATDSAGLITHFNSGAQETLGYSPEEVLGRSPRMFHTQEELVRQAEHFQVPVDHSAIVLEMVRRGERRDWEFLRKDETPRMASLTVSEVTTAEGQVVGFIGAGEDFTERLRAQEALMAALDREHASVLRLEEVDHVKQELVSNVSHELRTPLTSISGYAELLADGTLGRLNQDQVDALLRIEQNTARLGLLVGDLLTLSWAESGQLDLEHEHVDLCAVARESGEMMQEQLRTRTLDVRLVLPEHQVTVLGDAQRLRQVVTNLMSNAIKFTPDGGRVTLSVSRLEPDASLMVRDSGMGISDEDQEHVFTRFFRTAGATDQAIQGTGLGLSIVHSIVTQHDGSVAVESSPGAGTAVTVLLPLAPVP